VSIKREVEIFGSSRCHGRDSVYGYYRRSPIDFTMTTRDQVEGRSLRSYLLRPQTQVDRGGGAPKPTTFPTFNDPRPEKHQHRHLRRHQHRMSSVTKSPIRRPYQHCPSGQLPRMPFVGRLARPTRDILP
jgi:hypothetical protein